MNLKWRKAVLDHSKITLKGLGTVVGSLVILLGTAFAIDQRYEKAVVAQERYDSLKAESTKTRLSVQLSMELLRAQQLEDKIFELEVKPEATRSNSDNALILRYRRQLQDTQIRIHSLKAQLNGGT